MQGDPELLDVSEPGLGGGLVDASFEVFPDDLQARAVGRVSSPV
jgi:hypothetical protein